MLLHAPELPRLGLETRVSSAFGAPCWRRPGWLIPGDAIGSNRREVAAWLLKFEAHCLHSLQLGGTMNIQIAHSAKYPISRRALATYDILMVTAFGAWALLLGLSPVLVFHALT
jgi:hypothetical protein